jgi:hypothetical protein
MRANTTVRTSSTKRRVIGAVAVLMLAAGVAAAAWFVVGHGQGATGIGTLQTPTVAPSSSYPSDCFAGQDCVAHVVITNNNPSALVLTASAAGAAPGDTSSITNCDWQNVSVVPLTGLSIAIPVGSTEIAIPGALHLASSAPSSCQGQHVSRALDLTFATS